MIINIQTYNYNIKIIKGASRITDTHITSNYPEERNNLIKININPT